MRSLMLAVGWAAVAAAQTPPSQASISLIADRTTFFVGEQVRFSVVVRAMDGTVRTGIPLLWSSENVAVATVSVGLVAARSVGQTRIRATVDGEPHLSTGLNVQCLPKRIEVTPSGARVTVGQVVQFTARALDINNAPIPNVAFNWRVLADSGRGLPGISMDRATGRLDAQSTGSVHIGAGLAFPFAVSTGAQAIEALVPLQIDPPRHYDIKPIWRSSQREANPVFRYPGQIDDPLRGNARGQVVFQAAVGDVTRAMLMVEEGQVRSLGATGDPSVDRDDSRPTIAGFGRFSLNNEGDVLLTSETLGPQQLLLGGRGVARPVLLGGGAEAYNPRTRRVEPVYVSVGQISRLSLGDTGDLVANLQVTPLLGGVSWPSLFRISPGGRLQELLSSQVALPGLAAPYSIAPWQFGMATDLRVFFIGNAGAQRALYALSPDSTGAEPKVERILGIGDELQGARITGLDLSASPPTFFVGADGELVVAVNLEGRGGFLLRWLKGDWRKTPEIRQIQCLCGIYGSNENGTLFRNAGAATGGQGLLLWKRDGTVERPLAFNINLPNGERVTEIQGATLDAQGRVMAFVGTDRNPSTLIRIAGESIEIILRSGDSLPISPRTSVRPPLWGTTNGLPWANTASGSVVQLAEGGPQLRLGLGDPTLGNPADRFIGLMDERAAYETPDGLQFSNSAGLILLRPDGQQELTLRAPITPDVPNISRLGIPSQAGHKVWLGPSRSNDTRIMLASPGGEIRDLGQDGALPQSRMRFDDVEVVGFRSRPWATDDGRVVMEMTTAANGFIVAVWDNGAWRAIGVPRRSRVGSDGQLILNFDPPQVSGNRIFAMATLADRSIVVEWGGETWQTLVSERDRLPNGRFPTHVGIFSANRLGDMVVGTGEGIVAVRRRDGTFRYVFQRGDRLGDDIGVVINNVSIRDDGTLYITAGSPLGELVIYKASSLP
ncbi:MAG: Ig-like domain-containing protein [Bryobacteraceae bacterium]|nr:Ig-like domain-containing protein [Bryobacteraceae bacterium]